MRSDTAVPSALPSPLGGRLALAASVTGALAGMLACMALGLQDATHGGGRFLPAGFLPSVGYVAALAAAASFAIRRGGTDSGYRMWLAAVVAHVLSLLVVGVHLPWIRDMLEPLRREELALVPAGLILIGGMAVPALAGVLATAPTLLWFVAVGPICVATVGLARAMVECDRAASGASESVAARDRATRHARLALVLLIWQVCAIGVCAVTFIATIVVYAQPPRPFVIPF